MIRLSSAEIEVVSGGALPALQCFGGAVIGAVTHAATTTGANLTSTAIAAGGGCAAALAANIPGVGQTAALSIAAITQVEAAKAATKPSSSTGSSGSSGGGAGGSSLSIEDGPGGMLKVRDPFADQASW